MSGVAADPLICTCTTPTTKLGMSWRASWFFATQTVPKLQDLEPRYLCQPASSALIAALQADRDPAHWHEIYRRFDSELLE